MGLTGSGARVGVAAECQRRETNVEHEWGMTYGANIDAIEGSLGFCSGLTDWISVLPSTMVKMERRGTYPFREVEVLEAITAATVVAGDTTRLGDRGGGGAG
jgi:hypothetical protein